MASSQKTHYILHVREVVTEYPPRLIHISIGKRLTKTKEIGNATAFSLKERMRDLTVRDEFLFCSNVSLSVSLYCTPQ